LTGVLAAIHVSTLEIPLALVTAQTTWSFTGTPSHSNLRASNSTPGLFTSCCETSPPEKFPIVKPSGFATL